MELKRNYENTINNFNKNRKEEFADFEMAMQDPWSVRPGHARLHRGLFRFPEQWHWNMNSKREGQVESGHIYLKAAWRILRMTSKMESPV